MSDKITTFFQGSELALPTQMTLQQDESNMQIL
jgi:hypothetical protein